MADFIEATFPYVVAGSVLIQIGAVIFMTVYILRKRK